MTIEEPMNTVVATAGSGIAVKTSKFEVLSV
jgi:hypothetical protein